MNGGKFKASDIAKLPLGQHADGGGLIIDVTEVTTSDLPARAFLFRWTGGDGKRREIKMADCADLKISEARTRAGEWRQLVRDGKDPRFVRKEVSGITFKEFIEKHKADWSDGLAPSALYAWTNMLDAVPSLHARTVASIDLDAIVDALKPIYAKQPKTAKRHRWAIETALDSATVLKHRAGENPARWSVLKHVPGFKNLAKKASVVVNHPSMPYGDLPAFLRKLAYATTMSARCIEFTILTAARSQEARMLEWSEIDFDKGVWTCPVGKMKGRKVHHVPLSRQAIALLSKLEATKTGRFVFASTRTFGTDQPMRPHAVFKYLKTLVPDLTVHGFRATFRNWAGETKQEEHEVLEFCLAHVVGVGSSDRYLTAAMLDRRRAVMQAWADYCLPAKAAGNVVRLKVA